jgi:hypothetical protein
MGEGDGEATRDGPGDGLDVPPEGLDEAKVDVVGACALHAARINTAAARTGPLMCKDRTPALWRQLRPHKDLRRAWFSRRSTAVMMGPSIWAARVANPGQLTQPSPSREVGEENSMSRRYGRPIGAGWQTHS